MRQHTARCFEETNTFEFACCRNIRFHEGGVVAFTDVHNQRIVLILQNVLQFTAVNGTANNTTQRRVQLRHFDSFTGQLGVNRDDFIQLGMGRLAFGRQFTQHVGQRTHFNRFTVESRRFNPGVFAVV